MIVTLTAVYAAIAVGMFVLMTNEDPQATRELRAFLWVAWFCLFWPITVMLGLMLLLFAVWRSKEVE